MYSHIHACFIFRSKYAKPCCARASFLAQFSNLGLTLEMDWQWSPQAGPVVDLPGTGAAHDGPEVSAGSSAAKENSSEWAWQSPGTQHWVLPWPTRSCRTQPTDWLCTFGTEREQNCPSSARAAKAEGENLEFSPGQTVWPVLAVLSGFVHKTLALPCSGLCKSMV